MRLPFRWFLVLPGLAAAQLPAADWQNLVLDDNRSVIEVEVRSTFDVFTGRLQRFTAVILVNPDAQRVESARLDFKFADLRTGRTRRDRDMLEWEQNAAHPAVHFELKRLVRTAAEPVQAAGRLTMHGVEHAITFPVTFLIEGVVYSIDGELALDYRDYGLPMIRKFLLVTVDPHLRVRFHLQGRLAGDGK
jgi:polyisoprenoid-binding protein YceI